MALVLTSDLLRRLPKAELHCHLDGSLRPETLLDLAREYRQPLPRDDVDTLREYMLVKDARRLEDYLARFEVTLSVMQTAESLERIAYELAVDAAYDGVRYLEVRFAPILNTREGLSLSAAVDAPLRGLARGDRETGITSRIIVCGLRTMSPDVSLELARLAVSYRDRGVVAFDLAGAEAGNPASRHAAAFEYVLQHDFACTCHAGEGDGAQSIRDAVHGCGVHRVGHGTRLLEDPRLMQYITDRRIPIEVCLTSNVQTHAVAGYDTHPLRSYFDRGVNVVLNTDNRLMSGTTLTEEYAHAARSLGFTFDELAQVAMHSFESAFLPWKERTDLMTAAATTIAQLRAGNRG